jgi:hypothetical protein
MGRKPPFPAVFPTLCSGPERCRKVVQSLQDKGGALPPRHDKLTLTYRACVVLYAAITGHLRKETGLSGVAAGDMQLCSIRIIGYPVVFPP